MKAVIKLEGKAKEAFLNYYKNPTQEQRLADMSKIINSRNERPETRAK